MWTERAGVGSHLIAVVAADLLALGDAPRRTIPIAAGSCGRGIDDRRGRAVVATGAALRAGPRRLALRLPPWEVRCGAMPRDEQSTSKRKAAR